MTPPNPKKPAPLTARWVRLVHQRLAEKPAGVRLVALSLLSWTNVRTGTLRPSVGAIAALCRCSRRQVQQTFRHLRDRGMLEGEWSNGGAGRAHRLRLVLPEHENGAPPCAVSESLPDKNGAPPFTGGRTTVRPRAHHHARNSAPPCALTIHERAIEKNHEPSADDGGDGPRKGRGTPPEDPALRGMLNDAPLRLWRTPEDRARGERLHAAGVRGTKLEKLARSRALSVEIIDSEDRRIRKTGTVRNPAACLVACLEKIAASDPSGTAAHLERLDQSDPEAAAKLRALSRRS